MKVEDEPASVERERLAEAPPPIVATEVEQEVDFGRYGKRVLARWWLVLGAVIVGVIVGYLVSLGGGNVYRATATVYLGQPLSPGSGFSQVQSLATNPSTARQIARSRAVVNEVAEEVGIGAARLRSGVSTRTVSGAISNRGQNPLVEVSVQGPWREQTAQAANLLALAVVDGVSDYVDAKIANLEGQLESQGRELESIEAQIAANQAQIDAGELTDSERLLILNLSTILEQRRGQVLADQAQTEQLLTLATDVEQARVISEAAPVEVAARGARNSMLVGGAIGLLIGLVLALVWDPISERGRRARAT